jgi:hypothetical protein
VQLCILKILISSVDPLQRKAYPRLLLIEKEMAGIKTSHGKACLTILSDSPLRCSVIYVIAEVALNNHSDE